MTFQPVFNLLCFEAAAAKHKTLKNGSKNFRPIISLSLWTFSFLFFFLKTNQNNLSRDVIVTLNWLVKS